MAWNATSAARSRSSPTGHAATRDHMGAETREPMVDLASLGVSLALLQHERHVLNSKATGQTQGELA